MCNGSQNAVAVMTFAPGKSQLRGLIPVGWFPGAIGKVAIYDYLLTPAQITAHYQAMTGKTPTGSCANTCSF